MAGIKIVDLPALGRDLISTDLLELSLAGGTGSRKITGQEIMNASKLSVGNTPIINGAVGQVLFQGTGNVLQESANLFWDNTNSNLAIGTSTPTITAGFRGIEIKVASNLGAQLHLDTTDADRNASIRFSAAGVARWDIFHDAATNALNFRDTFAPVTTPLILFNGGNVGINTTTDAGFKLDVNGTARVQGNSVIKGSDDTNQAFALQITNLSGTTKFQVGNGSQHVRFAQWQPIGGGSSMSWSAGGGITLGVGINTSNQLYYGIDYGGGQSGSSTLGSFISLNLTPTINQTGASGAITRGIYVNPTLTSAFDFRAIETTAGNVIFNGGNVGIGTSSPIGRNGYGGGTAVEVVNNSTYTSLNLNGGNIASPCYFTLGAQGNAADIRVNNKPLQITVNAVDAFRIATTGNVLINTTGDAGFRLDVNGTARFSGAVTTPAFATSSNYLGIASTASGGIFGLTAGQPIYLWNRQTGTGNGIVIDDFNGVGANSISLNLLNISGAYSTSGTCVHNTFMITRAINMASGNQTVRGFYYNPTLTNTTGLTTHWAIHTTAGRVRFEGLPTSPTGLNAGDIYNDGGTLRIV